MDGSERCFVAATVAAAAIEEALRRLLRGRTWQAITCEIAWRATEACEAELELVEVLTGVADEFLSELIERAEFQIGQEAEHARREHLRWRPHDHEGAEMVATLEARDLAQRLLARAYEQAYLQTEEVARARQQPMATGKRQRPRFRLPRSGQPIPPLPALVRRDLARSHNRYGWRRANPVESNLVDLRP